MSNLNQSKTGLYRDASTDIHYGVVKRGGKQIKQPLETVRADIASAKLKQFLDVTHSLTCRQSVGQVLVGDRVLYTVRTRYGR